MTALIDSREDLGNFVGDPHYICVDCAREKGGQWPKGHFATFHQTVCYYCGDARSLCSTGDWNWTDGVPSGMKLGIRD